MSDRPSHTIAVGPTRSGRTDNNHPDERARRITARRHEHELGRSLANSCLRILGITGQVADRPGDRPHWPPGTVGSISHDAAWCVAVVARSTAVSSIGVDVEQLGPIDPATWSEIFTTFEQRRIAKTSPDLGTAWFSAKESVLKCLGIVATVRDLEVDLVPDGPDCGAFTCPTVDGLVGRWFEQAGHVFTVAVIR